MLTEKALISLYMQFPMVRRCKALSPGLSAYVLGVTLAFIIGRGVSEDRR